MSHRLNYPWRQFLLELHLRPLKLSQFNFEFVADGGANSLDLVVEQTANFLRLHVNVLHHLSVSHQNGLFEDSQFLLGVLTVPLEILEQSRVFQT
jgi:hypothetical protein